MKSRFRRTATVFALVAVPALAIACSTGTRVPEMSASNLSATSDAGNELAMPADCHELDLSSGVPLVSQTNLKFDTIGPTPVIRTVPTVFARNGDPTLPDKLSIFLHGRVDVGTISIDSDLTKLFSYVPSCLACGILQLDFSTNDAGASSFANTFAAVGGIVDVTTAITPNQTQGVLRGIELRELSTDAAGARTLLPGGQCFWITRQTFDVRSAGGCKPFGEDDVCGKGQYCMPANSIGTDGQCVTTGPKELGQACTRNSTADAPTWSSDCEPGLRCIEGSDVGDTFPTCKRVCDELASTNACPTGSLCGGGYNLCIADPIMSANAGLDPAAVGEACTVKAPTGKWASYCGGVGKKRGTCVDQDGFGVGLHAKCEALFASAATELPAGHIAGFVGFKDQNGDLSTLWPAVPAPAPH